MDKVYIVCFELEYEDESAPETDIIAVYSDTLLAEEHVKNATIVFRSMSKRFDQDDSNPSEQVINRYHPSRTTLWEYAHDESNYRYFIKSMDVLSSAI